MAEALVEAAPPAGTRSSAAQALDADRAWRALLAPPLRDRCGRRPGRADARGRAQRTRLGSPSATRASDDAVERRLTSTIDGAAPVLALAASGKGNQAWALGLAVRVLVDGPAGEARAAARTLLTVMLGGWAFDDRDARAWAQAAEDHVLDLLAADAPAGQATLQAADRAIGSLQAEALVGVSDLVTAGLLARLRDLASALARRRANQAEPGEVEQAAQRVRRHRLDDHHTLATMVVRLTRWLDEPAGGDAEFRTLAQAHVSDQAYADWARTTLRVATGEATLDEQLRALIAEADTRRRAQDVVFGARLASFVGHAAPGGPILGVEEVLDRVVAPIAKQRPVLLLVLDGMSHRVACELMEDVVARGWIELRPPGEPTRTLVLSALPSVTGFSRTSLLSGTLAKGAAPDEAKAFVGSRRLARSQLARRPTAALPQGRTQGPARRPGGRAALGACRRAARRRRRRQRDRRPPRQGRPARRAVERNLRPAAAAAARRGTQCRAHRDPRQRPRARARPRWSVSQRRPRTRGAVPLRSRSRLARASSSSKARACSPTGGAACSPWMRTCATPRASTATTGAAARRRSSRRCSFSPRAWPRASTAGSRRHTTRPRGGPARRSPRCQPLSHRPLRLRNRAASSCSAPSRRRPPERRGSRSCSVPRRSPPSAHRRVAARCPRSGSSRSCLPSSDAGGKLLQDALARRVGIAPVRLRGTLAVMRQLLNVDGYPVLSIDEDTGDVVLDVALLREQFGLGAAA